MTVPQFSIPTVDISPYLIDPESEAGQYVVAQIRDACRTSGFFQIIEHGVPRSLQEQVFEAAKLIFDLPLDEKLKLKGGSGRGYEMLQGQTLEAGKKPDLKEGFFVGAELPEGKQPRDFCLPNKWPSESLIAAQRFQVPLLDYQARLSALCMKIMQILAEGLPYCTPHTFDTFCTDPIANVRLLHYPPQPDLDDKKQLGAGAHTDFGAITLLLQDSAGGLQVLNQKSRDWVDVPPNSRSYVVNVGDMLDVWTKGEYKSNVHRVINRSGTHRYSVPFFFDGNVDYVLRPLDGSKEHGGPTVEEFMNERYVRSKVK